MSTAGSRARDLFDQSHNDILRAEAGLHRSPQHSSTAPGDEPTDAGVWTGKGVTLPAGTRLRMTYNGEIHTGLIESGSWVVNGGRYVVPPQRPVRSRGYRSMGGSIGRPNCRAQGNGSRSPNSARSSHGVERGVRHE